MTTGLIIGTAIGLFIPAPYDLIARNAMASAWNWVKNLVMSVGTEK